MLRSTWRFVGEPGLIQFIKFGIVGGLVKADNRSIGRAGEGGDGPAMRGVVQLFGAAVAEIIEIAGAVVRDAVKTKSKSVGQARNRCEMMPPEQFEGRWV